jgi:pyruvate dehydrogenase E1 component alpha subunit
MTMDQIKPRLDHAHVRALLKEMLRIRRFEDKCAELYTQEKIRGFLHLYDGEEAIASGIIPLLQEADRVVATYREHGHALARGVPMGAVLAEMYGKAEGCAGGRGGSMHLFSDTHNFYGGNAIVGGGLPLAIGLGLADQMEKTGNVTACFFGEGAVAEGEFHESLNLAALWKLPVLFVCENNGYAMGTALDLTESQTDISAKAASYGIASTSVDGMDVVAVEAAARKALSAIAESGAPQFLECKTYRFRAHSMFDAQLYRSRDEVAEWRARHGGPGVHRCVVVHADHEPGVPSVLLREEHVAVDADVLDALGGGLPQPGLIGLHPSDELGALALFGGESLHGEERFHGGTLARTQWPMPVGLG